MTNIHSETNEAENKFQHLFTHFGLALKSDDLKDIIEEHVAPQERYRPASNVPVLPGNIYIWISSREMPVESSLLLKAISNLLCL